MERVLCGAVLAGLLLCVGLPGIQAQMDMEENFSEDAASCNSTVKKGTIVLPPSLDITTCYITIEIPAGSKFTSILFSRLDLKGTDNLTIYDDQDQVLNVTGSRDSLAVVVFSQKAVLVVHINTNQSGSVLQATFNTTRCLIQQTVEGASMLQSPVYKPGKGPFNCSYVISQNASTNVQLAVSFEEVVLPNATLNITSSPGLVVNGTGTLPPDVYGNKIEMLLTVPQVNGSMQRFSAAVSPVIVSSVCGQVKKVSTNTLTLTVPASHPLPYDCRVTLMADKGASLWMNITLLQLAARGDSVEIVDGGSLAGNDVLASFSSSVSGHLVLSGQKQVLVRLVLGMMIGPRSLVVNVKKLGKVQHLYNSGNFSIPPSKGKAVVSQYYVMESRTNSSVKLLLPQQKMNTTFNVSVYDGDQPSSPLLVTFSANRQLGFPVVSSGSKVLVEARLPNNSRPLNLTFSSQGPGCDKITSAAEGMFQLMTLPKVPPMCRWTVTAPPNSTGTILLDMAMVKLSKKATVSVYSGVAGMGGSLVARFTNVSSMSSAPLPAVAVPAAQWAQVIWSSGNSSNLTSVAVNVRFQLVDALCGGQVKASQGHLRSPAFPNLYPLNTLCRWTFPPSKPGRVLFFDFPQFQVAQNHRLAIIEKRNGTSRRVVALFNSSSASLPDVLYTSNATNTVTFSALVPSSKTGPYQVAQGFDIRYWALNCGGFMNQSKGSFSSPGYPAQIPVVPANATLCVWFVNLTRKAGEDPKIVNMTLQFKKTGSPPLTDFVKVYDGNNIRANQIPLNISKGMNASVLSRNNTVIIVFNITAQSSRLKASTPKVAFMLNYTTFSCNKTFQCKNGFCMHPDWLCNGKDDCGDMSDEKNCVSPPTPTSSKKGMKPGIVVLLFFVGLALGILLALVIPRIIRRVRTNRYTAFRNESPVA